MQTAIENISWHRCQSLKECGSYRVISAFQVPNLSFGEDAYDIKPSIFLQVNRQALVKIAGHY